MKFSILAIIIILFVNCSTTHQSFNTKESIIKGMNKAADDWNNGNLDAFMNFYDASATFMLPTGPVGISGLKENYQKGFFSGNMPKQKLAYDEMVVRPLGTKYALLTGKYILSGNNLKERSGRYSLIFISTPNGWKILHDHSS